MGRAALWGFLIGTVLMTTVLMLGVALPGDDDGSAIEVFAGFVASSLFGVFLGGVPGSLVGLLVGATRRRAHPLPPPSRFPHPLPPPPPPLPPPFRPVRVNDRWAAMVGRCELAVHRVGAAVATVPPSPAREWLERIAAQFDGELSDVRRIADLGRALAAGDDHPVTRRLAAAVRDFTSFEDEVGRVALQVLDRPTLDAVRTHLEVLEQQLPHLGNV